MSDISRSVECIEKAIGTLDDEINDLKERRKVAQLELVNAKLKEHEGVSDDMRIVCTETWKKWKGCECSGKYSFSMDDGAVRVTLAYGHEYFFLHANIGARMKLRAYGRHFYLENYKGCKLREVRDALGCRSERVLKFLRVVFDVVFYDSGENAYYWGNFCDDDKVAERFWE